VFREDPLSLAHKMSLVRESCQKACVNCLTSREGVRSSFDKTTPILTARIELISQCHRDYDRLDVGVCGGSLAAGYDLDGCPKVLSSHQSFPNGQRPKATQVSPWYGAYLRPTLPSFSSEHK